MNKNKKISLGIAGAMIISIFLPFVKLGPIGMSLLDAVQLNASVELVALLVLIIAFGVLTYMDKHLFAKICSGLVLLALLYGAFKMADAGSTASQYGADINVFSILGIGAYLLLLSSVAGIIFSKPESK